MDKSRRSSGSSGSFELSTVYRTSSVSGVALSSSSSSSSDSVLAAAIENTDNSEDIKLLCNYIVAKDYDNVIALANAQKGIHGRDAMSPFENSALIVATSKKVNDVRMAKILLDAGADPNITAKHNYRPLHLAVINNNKEMVKLLLQRDANPNFGAEHRFTPLHTAAMKGFFEIIEVLLQYNADLTLTGVDNETALQLAKRFDHTDPKLLALLTPKTTMQNKK